MKTETSVKDIVKILVDKVKDYKPEERKIFIETFLIETFPGLTNLREAVEDITILVNNRIEDLKDLGVLSQAIELLKRREEDESVIFYLEALQFELENNIRT